MCFSTRRVECEVDHKSTITVTLGRGVGRDDHAKAVPKFGTSLP
jgi:hypothetical protein